jgi:argininosuccinate lyase
LADWLVVHLKLPFREAHHVTGKLVKLAEGKQIDLPELTLDDMQSVEPRITAAVFDVLSVESSVASRTSLGGTSPENVTGEAEAWRDRLKLQ